MESYARYNEPDPPFTRIAGALEIPGVSTYLHPLGDNYLGLVGRKAMATGELSGIKVELFDVRDIASPLSLDRRIVGGSDSWSDALYDLRAFNFLQVDDDQRRFTLLITRRAAHDWLDSGLYLYEGDGLAGDQVQLNGVDAIIAETNQGEAVYYVHGNQLWTSFWSSPEQVNGPF